MKHIHKLIKIIEIKSLGIEKRYRLVFSMITLSGLLLGSTFFFFTESYIFLPILIVATYLLTLFSVLEGIDGFEWFSLFIIPVLVTVAFYLFFFLFPVRWITRVPFIIIYGISIYAALLCSNIFNVGVEKSLQLYRAAYSVNFFYQTIVAFLLFNAIFSFRMNFIANALMVGIIAFALSLQVVWTIRLEEKINRGLLLNALLITLVMVEVAIAISFLPLRITITSLFLTAVYYSSSGLLAHFLDEKLFRETVREYLVVLGFTASIVLLSLKW